MQAQSPEMQWQKILVPIELPDEARRIVQQSAFLARHFRSEIMLLHVESSLRDDGLGDLDPALRRELDGISIRRLLLRGDPAREIAQVARKENVNLIAMATHNHGTLYRLLMGSVAEQVLHESACPVWIDAGYSAAPAAQFAIHNMLCALDLSPHSGQTLRRAAEIAAEFGARLTLVHVTPAVETFGPGGSYAVPGWKDDLVSFAAKQIARLQQDAGTAAEVIIGSGDLVKALNQAAEQSKSDLMVLGHLPPVGHMGAVRAGYGVIAGSHIPVLSV
ncbi:MAG: universal stress protein [Steroidobacteraceae bacterium]|jgi:nucleotide-binding universal stress UspA family protein